jgi:hypothetical protein
MQQGYVNGAKEQDACVLVSMRRLERKGFFTFLPDFQHLSAYSGTRLACGRESRFLVRRARDEVKAVKAALPAVH